MFLYFLPENERSAAGLAALAYAFEGSPIRQSIRGGPDGAAAGMVFADPSVPAVDVGYYPERQTWKKIPGLDAWLGRASAGAIGPEQLARTKQLRGELVALGDGNLWQIPIARAWTELDGDLRWYTALPQARKLDDAGKWTVGEVLTKYAILWDYASAWFEERIGLRVETPGTITLDFQGENEAFVAALAVNYRVAAFEVSELGLNTSDVLADVLDALIDWNTRMQWIKKKVRAESQTESAG